ncbi:hypothetical protein PtrV1_08287 [Pyrenophora tritici-repentis]|nr:hypothetical protein PtrV1_08287 [Pyrenophora tritici-repentis]KAI0585249.1 hypothetical protein Alg215_02640 [Pyrenophora tritici-repentis]PZD30208.1 hypothetical protein A1F96_04531 [Pyrenophora tritici-repentis]
MSNIAAPMEPEGDQNRPTLPSNEGSSSGHIECDVCAKLGRTLDCCKGLRGGLCLDCAEISRLLNREIEQQAYEQANLQIGKNDGAWRVRCDDLEARLKSVQDTLSKNLVQQKNDHIESLKKRNDEADAEDERLKKILEERDAKFKDLQKQLSDGEPPRGYSYKESKKGEDGNKK